MAREGSGVLTESLDDHGWEWRCNMRDPDGYLIEVGQYQQLALEYFENTRLELRGRIPQGALENRESEE